MSPGRSHGRSPGRIGLQVIGYFISIFFHVCYSNMHVIFFGIRPIEELQDPSNSPRREEVGRRTLGDYGGFLLPFFYRARFQLLTSRFSQASKTTTNKPPDTLGTLESTSPRRVLHF